MITITNHLFCYFRDLFNAAFVSCWSELNEDQQDELVNTLELALKSQNIQHITQTLLNLSEFMEHCEIKVIQFLRTYHFIVQGHNIKVELTTTNFLL